jgi:MFS family permease
VQRSESPGRCGTTPPRAALADRLQPSDSGGWQAVAVSSAGAVLAWYDFCVYLVLAPTLARHFLPLGDSLTGLWAMLAIYGAGFLIRPVGAVVFGRLADKLGRARALVFSLALLGLSTTAIGLLLSFDSAGPLGGARPRSSSTRLDSSPLAASP